MGRGEVGIAGGGEGGGKEVSVEKRLWLTRIF